MLRRATPADIDACVEVAVSAGLAPPEDSGFVRDLLMTADGGTTVWAVHEDDRRVTGVVFAQLEPATDRTWDLTMIAVDPAVQGGGRGTALMRHVEQALAERGQRLLLVRTSGTDGFAATRAFYAGLGYEEAARIADRWADGDDDVTFGKRLGR